MPSSKPKPSEVASDTKRRKIPTIKEKYSHIWPTHSYLFPQPLAQIQMNNSTLVPQPCPPAFYILAGDPVDFTIRWQSQEGIRIPFVCAANDKRPGGDWETNVVGYEERLCRRSNLSATLKEPHPESGIESNYPIPSEGGIYSEHVVVFRGPHDHYVELEEWYDLPVVSIPAARWPKLSQMGAKFAFPLEREMVKNKMRAALRISAYYGHRSVVIGDFGLGNTLRNPPQELAELWRDVFLYDPELRGRFDHVTFAFEDPAQSTSKLIMDDLIKKSKGGPRGKSSSSSSKSSSKSNGSSSGSFPTDIAIFQHAFDPQEIQQVMTRPDPRYGISMLTS